MKVGVIGTGVMGENHVRVYQSLGGLCELVGIHDCDQVKGQNVADKYQTRYYDSLEKLLQEVDAVSIAVPPQAHLNVALICCQYQVDMLMEKPVAATVEEAVILKKQAKAAGVTVQVGHIELFNPVVEVLEKVLEREKVLAVDMKRMSHFEPRNKNNNVITDLMIHDIYILRHLFKHPIQKTFSFGQAGDGVIHHATSLSQYEDGMITQMTASYKTEEKIRMMNIITEAAYIRANLLTKSIQISRSTNFFYQSSLANYSQQNIVEKIYVPNHEPLKNELSHFIKSVVSKQTPIVAIDDGIGALQTSFNILAAIKKQRD